MKINSSSSSSLSPPINFPVKRREPELISPAKPTPKESKYLSDIDDQEHLRSLVPFIMFYPSNNQGKDPAIVIKTALSKALVDYYPFAGRLREGPNRKLIVDCTGEGVLFTEADAGIRLDQFGDPIHPPFPYINELLFDVPGSSGIVGCPVLLIQVTRLMCGGFILGVRFNHAMADSLGLVQFLNAVAEIARGADKPSLPPVWQREIFAARDPPQVTHQHHAYDETSINTSSTSNLLIQRCFVFTPEKIKLIRYHFSSHDLSTSSTLDVLTTCLWKSLTLAWAHNLVNTVRISRAITVHGKEGMKIPPGFYGNAFAYMTVELSAKLLCEKPLTYALELVKTAKYKMSKEYMRSLADFLVVKGRPQCDNSGRNFLVADTTRVGFEKVDFGWGEAVYGGPTGTVTETNYYVGYKSKNGERGIVVPMWLPPLVMERFEYELKKMTGDNNNNAPELDGGYGPINTRFLSML